MLRRTLCVAAALFLSVVPAFGQAAVAEINGSASDQTGAALPGTTVTITEESTGLTRTTFANDDGRFVMPAVQPGRYTVRAELPGFQSQSRGGVTVLVGQAVTLAFTMPIGALTDVVTVTGEAPLVEVTQTQIGTNITAHEIENLPMQGRVQMSLMQLVPGLVPNLTSGTFEGTNYSANGRETQGNLYLVDGVWNRDDRSMAFAQANVTVDSIAEFQVLSHDYGAEYGGASGVIVNAVTKSGTNQFHGRAFYYGQDNSLNADNYFTKLRGEKDPESGSGILGGSVGGPILRNKAFFFFNYERTWLEEAVALEFPREAAPLAVPFSDVYKANVNSYFARVDYQLTPGNNISYRLIMSPNDGIGENAESEQSIKENFRWERSQEMINNISWTATIGNRMLNELKIGSTYEALKIADRQLFNEAFKDDPFDVGSRTIPGFRGVDPLDFGPMQQTPITARVRAPRSRATSTTRSRSTSSSRTRRATTPGSSASAPARTAATVPSRRTRLGPSTSFRTSRSTHSPIQAASEFDWVRCSCRWTTGVPSPTSPTSGRQAAD